MPVRPADNTASSLASIATTLCAMPELNTATSQKSAMSRYIPVSDLTLLNNAVRGVDAHIDAVGDKHLDRGAQRRFRQRMGVLSQEQRAVDALRAPVPADGLRGGQDVPLVERSRRRGPAVAGGAEADALLGLAGVGLCLLYTSPSPRDGLLSR